jgi:glycosyltransferase involved in cell wall biosynthesis
MEHPDIVKYLEHHNHRNRGLPASRNLGMRIATGDYIAPLDSDDAWLPHKLEQQVAMLDSHPTAVLLYGATQYWHSWAGNSSVQEQDYVQGPRIPANTVYEPPVLLKLHLSGQASSPCPSDLLFRKENIVDLGGFEESFVGVLSMYEDQAFLAKVYSHLPVFISDMCWDRYRLHSGSLCARVKKAGQHEAVTAFYLNWLVAYLSSQGMFDGEIRELVQRDVWRNRHPTLYLLSRAGPALVRRARYIGARLVKRRGIPP